MSSSKKKKRGGGSNKDNGGRDAAIAAAGAASTCGGADGCAGHGPSTNGKSSWEAAATATGQGADDSCRQCETHSHAQASHGGDRGSSSSTSDGQASPPSAAPPPSSACEGGGGGGGGGKGGPKPVVVDKAQVIRLAGQYTPCAGCGSAVKALLARPGDVRLLSAVMADDPEGNCLRLRDAYLLSPQRTAQLLETFPLQAIARKVQPQGGGLRCTVHKRQAALQSGAYCCNHKQHRHHSHHNHHHESWDWEDAWDRLPAAMKERVATLELRALESAMHHATAQHRFCVDCKHNVVTAMDLLAGRYAAEALENKDEYNADLFAPFAGRVKFYTPVSPTSAAALSTGEDGDGSGSGSGSGSAAAVVTEAAAPAPAPTPAAAEPSVSVPVVEAMSSAIALVNPAGRTVLACAVDDVDELISWHEDFDSQEYAASGQRHAATLEHGQREIRSLVGGMLLSQLRTCWHAHAAQVQAEQYLFHLVVHALRMQLGSGSVVAKAIAAAPHSAIGAGGGLSGIDGARAAELAASRLLEEVEAEDGEKKSKSRKKKERRAKAKAARSKAQGGDGEGDNEADDDLESTTAPASSVSSSNSPSPPPSSSGGKQGSGKKEGKQPAKEGQPALQSSSGSSTSNGKQPGLPLLQSCYDREAEERLLRALGGDAASSSSSFTTSICSSTGVGGPLLLNGSGGGGGGGMGFSLLDQLGPDDEACGEEGDADIDPALLREMEQLKSSLEARAEHREHLRSKLASQFQQYCSGLGGGAAAAAQQQKQQQQHGHGDHHHHHHL